MTPDRWNTSYPYMWSINNGVNSNYGRLISTRTRADFTTKTIPVISLKACVKYSRGDGTPSSPYEVTIDDTCANVEN